MLESTCIFILEVKTPVALSHLCMLSSQSTTALSCYILFSSPRQTASVCFTPCFLLFPRCSCYFYVLVDGLSSGIVLFVTYLIAPGILVFEPNLFEEGLVFRPGRYPPELKYILPILEHKIDLCCLFDTFRSSARLWALVHSTSESHLYIQSLASHLYIQSLTSDLTHRSTLHADLREFNGKVSYNASQMVSFSLRMLQGACVTLCRLSGFGARPSVPHGLLQLLFVRAAATCVGWKHVAVEGKKVVQPIVRYA